MQSGSKVIHTANFVGDAAAFILEQARKAIAERNEFRIALSGGNTPAPVYRRLAARGDDLPWDRIRFTFGDERCVPPDDPQSNFRMARENLFMPADVPEKSIMRMRGEIDPQIAARDYEQQLAAIARQCGEPMYQHDLILLGLGPDGHTASLFPGTAALEEMTRTVAGQLCSKIKRVAVNVHISADQSRTEHLVSRRRIEESQTDRQGARRRLAISCRAGESYRRRSDMDDRRVKNPVAQPSCLSFRGLAGETPACPTGRMPVLR